MAEISNSDKIALRSSIFAAQEGDINCAIHLLEQFVIAVENNDELDRDLLDYISQAFLKIIDEVPPDKALNIKRLKRRPLQDNDLRDLRLAQLVYKGYDGKNKLTGIQNEVANDNNVSLSVVQRAYYKYKNIIPILSDSELAALYEDG